MKARINGWTLDVDIQRDLASNPHRVEVTYWARNVTRGQLQGSVEMSAGEAATLAPVMEAARDFLDELAGALADASVAGDCDLCGGPCDPGEADCPRCQDAS